MGSIVLGGDSGVPLGELQPEAGFERNVLPPIFAYRINTLYLIANTQAAKALVRQGINPAEAGFVDKVPQRGTLAESEAELCLRALLILEYSVENNPPSRDIGSSP